MINKVILKREKPTGIIDLSHVGAGHYIALDKTGNHLYILIVSASKKYFWVLLTPTSCQRPILQEVRYSLIINAVRSRLNLGHTVYQCTTHGDMIAQLNKLFPHYEPGQHKGSTTD